MKTVVEIDRIRDEANRTITEEVLPWYPAIHVAEFQVSSAQVRHVLAAVEKIEMLAEIEGADESGR